ncbi:hypothetical protein Tco_0374657 [Tanacetum coccineum]
MPELPPTSSRLSGSSGFGNQFLNLSSDISLVGTVKDSVDHDNQDEDPTAGSDQGKDKKRPRKYTQPSKKSSTSKEYSKGNTPPKSYKPGKSVTAEEPNEEHVQDMSLDAKENVADETGNADEHPDSEAEPKTNNAPKNDLFKLLEIVI